MHHINDQGTTCDHVKYADDCTMWESCSYSASTARPKAAANEVAQWITATNMALNYAKMKKICIFFKKNMTSETALVYKFSHFHTISRGNSTTIKSPLKHRNKYKLFHNSTQATRSRTPTSCQDIYNNNPIGH